MYKKINNDFLFNENMKKYLNLLPNDVDNLKIIPHVIDLESYFNTIIDPIIINKIPLKVNFMKDIIKYISDNTNREDEIISCKCKALQGKYFEGLTCKECNTKVEPNLIKNLQNEVWFTLEDNNIKVPNPLIYLIISYSLKEGNSASKSYLDYILDITTDYPDDLGLIFKGKGFKYFYENFDFIMDYFIYTYPKTRKRKNIQLLKILLNKYRDRIFTNKLPIMSKFIQPITKSGYSLRLADESLTLIVKSILSIVLSRYTDILESNVNVQFEKNMYRMYSNYIQYIQQTIKKKYSLKKSYFRKNIFGTKLHFTFRNVIAPIYYEHFGDEIHVPWKTGLTIYMYHLMNILINRMEFSPTEAHNKISKAYYRYDPIIDQIFQLLILESRFKGLPILLNRNPTLLPSGTFLVFIIKFKNELTPISEAFIKNFGNISPNKNITTEYIYNKKELYISRKKIIKNSNGYDTPDTIKNIDYSIFEQEDSIINKKKDLFNNLKNKDNIQNITNDIVNLDTTKQETKLTTDTYNCTISNRINKKINKVNIYNRSISDKTLAVSYLPAKLTNMDYDGDSLDAASVLENDLAEEILQRIHPSSFFIGNGSMEIKGNVHIPRQNILTLNSWLHDK